MAVGLRRIGAVTWQPPAPAGTRCNRTSTARNGQGSGAYRSPVALSDRLRRLDERVFKELRRTGETAESYLRRVAASGGIAVRDGNAVHAALREHFVALDAERAQRGNYSCAVEPAPSPRRRTSQDANSVKPTRPDAAAATRPAAS